MAMGKPGAPLGNKNGSKNKEWEGALRIALANYADDKVKRGQALRKIADTVVLRAMAGDKDAWQEIGNRLDGKPKQEIAGEVKGDITVQIVRFSEAA